MDYRYKNYEYTVKQNIAGLDVSVNLTKKLAFHVYYEGTFEKEQDAIHRANLKLIRRF